MQSLRTRGDMSFEEICLTIPCLEMAHDHAYGDLQAPQVGCLRAYKTHFWRPHCPLEDKAKYIYIIRDPVPASTSFFHFLEGWVFPDGALGVRARFLATPPPPASTNDLANCARRWTRSSRASC